MPKENPEDRIDPRYNAAFQRGYQGPDAVGADPERPSPRPIFRSPRSVEPAARPIPLDRSDGFGASDGSDASRDLRVEPSEVPESDESALPEGHSRPTEALSARPGPPMRGNPYFTALWVIGIVFVAGGVILQVWAQLSSLSSGFYRPGSVPIESVIVDVAYAICAPAITVGLATIVALLFVRALRPTGRTQPADRS